MGNRIIVIICLFFCLVSSNAMADLVYNGDGSVTDTETGLMWQQATQSRMDWDSANDYCESLLLAGHGDWRLPSMHDFFSLQKNHSNSHLRIDTAYFPDAKFGYYWSSTTYRDTKYMCCAHFGSYSWFYDTSESYFVIAVRAGYLSAVIDTPSPAVTIFQGDSVKFTGSVSRGETPYIYWWDFAGIGGMAMEDTGDITFTWPGVYPVVFWVQDNLGTVASDTVTVTVTGPDDRLKATIDTPVLDETIATGGYVNFTGRVSGGTEPYIYWWDFGSILEDPGVVTFSTAGTYPIIFYVQDGSGKIALDSVIVTVAETESDLSATIDTPSGNTVIAPGDSVNYTGSASGGLAPYIYWWDFGSTLEDPGGAIPFSGMN